MEIKTEFEPAVEQCWNELEEKIRAAKLAVDFGRVRAAFNVAASSHDGQKRRDGSPYVTHCAAAAGIIVEMGLDEDSIVAALLHDTIEDTPITYEDIHKQFGPDVADIVEGVTKLTRVNYTSREDEQMENMRKMLMAMSKDIRVILIKLADRLHNMRTLKYQKPERQVAIARETLDVYAPLAHRLGIFAVKWEMEDLALRYIDPEGYYKLVELVGAKRKEREHVVQLVIDQLQTQLTAAGIHAEISGRPKHFYSIYRKMKTQNKTFDQIHDLFAVRVLVDTVPDCYSTLGIVNTLWTMVPGRIKDYISMPKANMYQSLHTTVVGTSGELRGQTFEVQIRTFEMHRTAEYGIAAHWRYKEGKQADTLDDKLYWLRQILDWQNDARDPSEFMDALRVDLFSDEVFVFTPKGDVINLPKGATPIDFAYRIHSAIGNKCVGAKINGRIVTLDTPLNTGDFVEILTSSTSRGPSQDWLKLAKTSDAKTKIRAFFKRELHDENAARGHDMLEREARRLGYSLGQLTKPDYLDPIFRRYTLHSLDDIFVTVGFGGLSSAQIINRLVEEMRKNTHTETVPEIKPVAPAPPKDEKRSGSHHTQGVIVEGDPGMLVRFAHCCNPLPGDDIVGYITRGRGVSIHRRDCTNMDEMMLEPERFIKVHWESESGAGYEAGIRVIANDRVGLLADISVMLAQLEVPIVAVSARTDKSKPQRVTIIDLVIAIKDTNQLENIINRLLKRGDILEVFRTNN